MNSGRPVASNLVAPRWKPFRPTDRESTVHARSHTVGPRFCTARRRTVWRRRCSTRRNRWSRRQSGGHEQRSHSPRRSHRPSRRLPAAPDIPTGGVRTLRQLRSLSDVPRRAYWARIKRILYAGTRADAAEIGFDDERIYRELARPLNERSLEMRQLLREEALAAFVQWRDQPDKTPY